MSQTTRRPTVIVNNVLFDRQARLMLTRRADNGLWCTPGGHVEDESAEEAGRREQREETGLTLEGKPESLGYTELSRVGQGKGPFLFIHLLWKRWSGTERPLDSVSEVRWFSHDELPQPPLLTVGTIHALRLMAQQYARINGSFETIFRWADVLRGY